MRIILDSNVIIAAILILETFNSIPIISHWNFWQIAKAEMNNFS